MNSNDVARLVNSVLLVFAGIVVAFLCLLRVVNAGGYGLSAIFVLLGLSILTVSRR